MEDQELRWRREEQRAVRSNDHASAAVFHKRRWAVLEAEMKKIEREVSDASA